MTNTEAITWLSQLSAGIEWELDMNYAVAIDMAIEALRAQDVPDTNVGDMISKNAVLQRLTDIAYNSCKTEGQAQVIDWVKTLVCVMPSAQPETCEGCKHLNKWENEVEYGYPSPCTRCKRRTEDNYER